MNKTLRVSASSLHYGLGEIDNKHISKLGGQRGSVQRDALELMPQGYEGSLFDHMRENIPKAKT